MAHAHPDPLKLTHQCEVLGQMLIEKRDCGNDMQTLACLKLILEQLKKTMAPLGFDVPDYNGAIDAEQALKATLNRLREKLNNPSEFESPWKLCCEALELVKELLYQQEYEESSATGTNAAASTAPPGSTTAPGSRSLGPTSAQTDGGVGSAMPVPTSQYQKQYSHFQDPVVLADSPGAGNPRPPRDIRTPVRRRFNRITGKAIWTPEVILISCTEGRDLRAQISNFESTGVGPHYVISRNGELVNLVDEKLCAWWGNPACWRLVPPVYHFEGVGDHSEVHYYAVSVGLEGEAGKEEGFTDCQYQELIKLISSLKTKYHIKGWNILGLEEVCMPPGRYTSPGRYFDWHRISSVTFNVDAAPEGSAAPSLRQLMEDWGYGLGLPGDDATFQQRLQIFQHRYEVDAEDENASRAASQRKLSALIHARSLHNSGLWRCCAGIGLILVKLC